MCAGGEIDRDALVVSRVGKRRLNSTRGGLHSGDRSGVVLRPDNEFQEPQLFSVAGIPMGVRRASRDKEAVSRSQRHRLLSLFLPDARACQNAEGYRSRMIVARVNC